jgi:hypothetical protein
MPLAEVSVYEIAVIRENLNFAETDLLGLYKTICSIRESAKPSRPVSSIQLDIYRRAEVFSHSWL